MIQNYENIFGELLRKIPEEKILKQEGKLEEIQEKLLEMFDIKFVTSSTKLKERYDLFIEGYTKMKNSLLVGIATKLKSNVNFIV